jgi:iron(III) transport system substrate-binding protein
MTLAAGCGRESSPQVVVYTSQDRVYAEPIFQEFTRRTGIKVNALYDSEAAKTVGLANRLLAEKTHPQCDLFWNNEELRTWQLAARDVVETNWLSLGYRARRLVLNTNHLPVQTISSMAGDGKGLGLRDLATSAWSGKVALAYPLFGTTATHLMALRQYWGEKKWEQWCRALRANKPFLVEGNSAVVNLVGRGEAWAGLTDSDDVAAGQREGLPVAGLALNDVPQMLIPNTVSLVIRRRHTIEAKTLAEFLGEPATLKRLVEAHALDGVNPPETVSERLVVNYPDLLRDLDAATHTLEEIFLK